MAMLSTVPYSKTGDARINCLLDQQYKSALNRLRCMNDRPSTTTLFEG
jgi:hypothetical protein